MYILQGFLKNMDITRIYYEYQQDIPWISLEYPIYICIYIYIYIYITGLYYGYHQDSLWVLQKYFANIIRMPYGYCRNISRIIYGYYKDITREYAMDTTRISNLNYQNIYLISQGYHMDIIGRYYGYHHNSSRIINGYYRGILWI